MTKVADAGEGFAAHPSAATANRVRPGTAVATNYIGQRVTAIRMTAEAQKA